MMDPALPRDHFGYPYQPLFWFDEQSGPIGMVVHREHHVVAWENNAEGDPDVAENATCQRVPAEVAHAAWDWWNEQLEA